MTTQTLQPGQTVLGHYTVVGTIGQGGMGAVHKVFDTQLGVHRALKVIAPPKGAADAMIRHLQSRFAVEARNLAQLRHPGVCSILSFGSLDDGAPYLLMEYLDGSDLMAWRSHNPSLERILEMAKQLASALSAIHLKGMIHRDIKLTNILVTDPGSADEQLVVIDFGLAKTDDDPKLTNTGMLAGTSWYLAPEYVKDSISSGGTVRVEHTELSDIWAMGCVLYSLCAHRNVWTSTSLVTIHSEIVQGDFPAVETVRTDISADFAKVIAKFLSVDPTRRFQTAKEALDALTAVVSASDETKTPFVAPTPDAPPNAGTRVIPDSAVVGSSLLTSPGRPAAGVNAGEMKTVPSQRPSQPPVPLTNDAMGIASVEKQEGAISSLFSASTPELSLLGDPSTSKVDVAPAEAESVAPGEQAVSAEAVSVGDFSFPDAVPPDSGNAVEPSLISKNSAYARMAPAPVEPSPVPSDGAKQSDEANEFSLFTSALSTKQEPSRLVDVEQLDTPSAPVLDANVDEPVSEPTPALMPSVPKLSSAPAYQAEENKLAGSIVARKNFVAPAIAAIALCLIFVGIFLVGGDLMSGDAKESLKTAGFVDPKEIKRRQASNEVAKLQKESKSPSAGLLGLQMPTTPDRRVAMQRAPIPQGNVETVPMERPEPARTTRRASRSGRSKAKAPTGVAPPPAVDPYAGYGRRAHDGNMAGNAVVGGKTRSSTTEAATAAGTRISARLKGAISSSPPGPVIAVVTKAAVVGGLRLPKGAEIHGTTAGASNNLIQVQFKFVLSKGKKTMIRGRALAPDGRSGIPAKRVSGGASDIAASATEAGIRAIGEGAASAVGDNPLGAAIRGGTAPAAGKARRLDHAQNVFQTRRNARFKVYVEALR